MKTLFALLIIFSASSAGAQETWNTAVKRELVIVLSTKDYKAARNRATEAAWRLGYPLELGPYKPHNTAGLSMSREDCEGSAFEYPCYVPRGNGSEPEGSPFVSIEWSTGYEGFKPGYYIVVVADGAPGSATSRGALAGAKRFYKDAYAKTTRVWYGCMH